MDASKDVNTAPGYRKAYNINPDLIATNELDLDGNPTGGFVRLSAPSKTGTPRHCIVIDWQDGPRGITQQGQVSYLADPNGAFVEDVLWAALQRLEFFNESKYRCRENSIAITKIEEALFILKDRQLSRSGRNVEGKYEV